MELSRPICLLWLLLKITNVDCSVKLIVHMEAYCIVIFTCECNVRVVMQNAAE